MGPCATQARDLAMQLSQASDPLKMQRTWNGCQNESFTVRDTALTRIQSLPCAACIQCSFLSLFEAVSLSAFWRQSSVSDEGITRPRGLPQMISSPASVSPRHDWPYGDWSRPRVPGESASQHFRSDDMWCEPCVSQVEWYLHKLTSLKSSDEI